MNHGIYAMCKKWISTRSDVEIRRETPDATFWYLSGLDLCKREC